MPAEGRLCPSGDKDYGDGDDDDDDGDVDDDDGDEKQGISLSPKNTKIAMKDGN